MSPATCQHVLMSGRLVCWVATILAVAAVTSAAGEDTGDDTSADPTLPTLNAHLAECYETLLSDSSRLCAMKADTLTTVVTSDLNKCLFGRLDHGSTEHCKHDTSPSPAPGGASKAHGLPSLLHCLKHKAYKSSPVYGTVLTSLLSICAVKEATQQMVEVSVARAVADRTESIIPPETLEELLNLPRRVNAVYSLVLEHTSWINLVIYYSVLAIIIYIAAHHPSCHDRMWQHFGLILLTFVAEQFLCSVVVWVINVHSSQSTLSFLRWTVRWTGLAASAVYCCHSCADWWYWGTGLQRARVPPPALGSQDIDAGSDDRHVDAPVVALASDTLPVVPATPNAGSGTRFVSIRVPVNAVVSLVQVLRLFPNSTLATEPDPPVPGRQGALSCCDLARIHEANMAAIEAGNVAADAAANGAADIAATVAAGTAANGAADTAAVSAVDRNLLDYSSDSPTPDTPRQSENCNPNYVGYTVQDMLNCSFKSETDTDDGDYVPPEEGVESSSDEEDEDEDSKDDKGDQDDNDEEVPQEELDDLLRDQRDGLAETVTAETMNLSYTIGTYVKGDRTILERSINK